MAESPITQPADLGDPSSGPPQQQSNTVESSPPTPAPGDTDAGAVSTYTKFVVVTAEQKRKLAEQKRKLMANLRVAPEKSNREHADIVGASCEVVAAIRAKMEAARQITGDGAVGLEAAAAPKSAPASEVERCEPEAAATESRVQQVQPATAEDIANQETAEKLALQIWAAIVAGKVLGIMSELMDELIQSPLLNDEDEEVDEDWLGGHQKREKQLLNEAIADTLEKYPDIDAVNNLPPSTDPDVVRDAEQLKDVLIRCRIGATEIKEKFSQSQLERMVKRQLEKQFKKAPKYSEHIRADIPGGNVKKYGRIRRTSSSGAFYKTADYIWRTRSQFTSSNEAC
jgi:hypothetical protein